MKVVPAVALGALLMVLLSGVWVPVPHRLVPESSSDHHKHRPNHEEVWNLCEEVRIEVEAAVEAGILRQRDADYIIDNCLRTY